MVYKVTGQFIIDNLLEFDRIKHIQLGTHFRTPGKLQMAALMER